MCRFSSLYALKKQFDPHGFFCILIAMPSSACSASGFFQKGFPVMSFSPCTGIASKMPIIYNKSYILLQIYVCSCHPKT